MRMINSVLFALLAGDLEQLEKLFEIDGVAQDKSWSVTLKAREPGLAKAIGSIALDGGVYVKNIVISEASGDRTDIVFSAIQTGDGAMSADEAALVLNQRTLPAWLWAAVVCLLLAHNVYLWIGQRLAPDSDILALLPVEERDPVLQNAFSKMVESAQQRLIVLVGADDWVEAGRAADNYLAVLAPHKNLLQADEQIAQQPQQDWLALFQQHRLVLVTPGDEAALRSQAKPYWVDTALAKLYSPFGGVKPGAWGMTRSAYSASGFKRACGRRRCDHATADCLSVTASANMWFCRSACACRHFPWRRKKLSCLCLSKRVKPHASPIRKSRLPPRA